MLYSVIKTHGAPHHQEERKGTKSTTAAPRQHSKGHPLWRSRFLSKIGLWRLPSKRGQLLKFYRVWAGLQSAWWRASHTGRDGVCHGAGAAAKYPAKRSGVSARLYWFVNPLNERSLP